MKNGSMLVLLLGIIIGLIVAVLVLLVVFLYRQEIEQTLYSLQNSVEPKGEILEALNPLQEKIELAKEGERELTMEDFYV